MLPKGTTNIWHHQRLATFLSVYSAYILGLQKKPQQHLSQKKNPTLIQKENKKNPIHTKKPKKPPTNQNKHTKKTPSHKQKTPQANKPTLQNQSQNQQKIPA